MRLKKLELYGFKSFAQRTEIVFNGGITGIVGPNGSGKSNIGDAVRWVLGEQSAKTLRGASMADVIFNGTQKRKPLSYCEVSLVFDNEDHALASDFTEVMVTRRVYRSGESEYFLGRSACRLKDIIDLFRDTGIGKEGYSIIGQGRIDEILSRKSEDRRQVFEEAAGIVKFKVRKEEADKKLQRTLENAARIDDILEELNRQLGPLEKQSRTAREYLELSGELKTLDLNLFLLRTAKANQRLAELDSELMTLRTVLSDAEATLSEKAELRDRCQTDITALDERITAARERLMACADTLHETQSQLTALTSRRESRRENRERVLEEQQDAQARLEALEKLQASSDGDIEAQQALAAQAEALLESARQDADQAAKDEAEKSVALEAHKENVLSAMNRLSAVRNDQTRLKTMRGQMEERLQEINRSQESLQTEETRLEQLMQEAQQRLEGEQQRQEACSQALQEAQDQVRAAELRLSAIRTEADNLSSSLQGVQSRWRLLSEMTREMEGYNQSVRRAVAYGKERGFRGVKGVLAQLIQVPARYETAIDMALGAAQQNIVTDNEETAKALIDYLRQNRLGRATFLPISAIRGKTLQEREKQALRMPGCIGVASELISCAPECKGIVDSLLGRTVIADNLEHGIQIMRAGNHAFRLVTLEGDVMHSGGSMTGGSAQSRMVNLLSREREVKELEEKLRTGKARLDTMRERLTAAQEERAELTLAADTAMNDLHQQEIAVARETERTERARQELSAHRGRMEETAQAALQLQDSMEEIDGQLAAIDQAGDDVQLDQSAMEERTAALQAALAEARRVSQEASDRVMTRTLQLSDARHTLDVMQRDSTRYAEDKQSLQSEQQRRAAQLAAMEAQEKQDAEEANQLEEQCTQRQADVKRQEVLAQSMETRRTGCQERLREILHDMEGLHESYNRDNERVHKLDMTRTRVDTELRNLQDRIWNTYELTYAGAEAFRQEPFNQPEAEKRVAVLNGKIRALGSVNVNAVEEYAKTKARYDELITQQEDLRKAEADLRDLIERLLSQMRVTFVESFTKMQGYFSETFVRLFGGGHAELKLMDPEDPLNCGIEVNAQPPGKKLQLLSLLSGGERALCAIAILFATLKLKPTPFCILDEIEAALDDANIGYYADYLKEYSQSTQFIVITHRKGTMERCDALYGVAMEEQGVSKMVSVSLQDYDE